VSLKKQLLLGVAVGALMAGAPALAADMALKAPPPPQAPVYNWTGWYVGGNIGYSWGNADANYTDPGLLFGLTSFPGSMGLDGVVGGGQAGYNWQANNNWVFGLEADIQASGEDGSRNYSSDCEGPGRPACPQSQSAKIDWFGTVRGSAGVLVNPTLLVYATGGLAYGRVSLAGSVSSPFGAWGYSGSAVNTGWTVGGGLRGLIPSTTQWYWRVEYLYLDLGSNSGTGSDPIFASVFSWNAKFTDNIVRLGIDYQFR